MRLSTWGSVLAAVLLGGAAVARLGAAAAKHEPLAGDEHYYQGTALLLLETGRYLSVGEGGYSPVVGEPTAYRNPGLPVLLAITYAVAGTRDARFGRLVVATVSLLALAPIVWCGARVFGDRLVGLGAAVAFAFCVDISLTSTALLPEGPAAVLLTSGIALLLLGARVRSSAVAGGAGLLCGLAVLFRVHLVPAVALVALVLISWDRRRTAAFACAAALLPAAWTLRNALVLGTPTLSTQTISLWHGHGPFARGGWPADWPPQRAYLKALYPAFDDLGEVARARLFRDEAWRGFKEHPLRSVVLAPKKVAIGLSPWSYGGLDPVFAVLLPLSVVGLLLAWRRVDRQALLILAAPIAGTLAACALVFGDPRFRCVVDGFIALFAAYGASELMRPSRRTLPTHEVPVATVPLPPALRDGGVELAPR
jgi:4-amino-4-deoxy-L-arabinose transferase-like glycosyltransferase